MKPEITKLIDNPETLRDALKINVLDRMVRKCFCVHGLTLRMKYSVAMAGRFNEPRFNASSDEDMTSYSGIFKSVLSECKIDTFSQHIDWSPENGYRVWFQLHLSYKHFNGGSNGMTIAEFRFENGEWTKTTFKAEEE